MLLLKGEPYLVNKRGVGGRRGGNKSTVLFLLANVQAKQ